MGLNFNDVGINTHHRTGQNFGKHGTPLNYWRKTTNSGDCQERTILYYLYRIIYTEIELLPGEISIMVFAN